VNVNGTLYPWWNPASNPVVYAPAAFHLVSNFPSSLTLPDSLGGNFVMVTAELCDCPECELVPGQGRCITYKYFSKVVPPPSPNGALAAPSSSSLSSPGPGEAVLEVKRRDER